MRQKHNHSARVRIVCVCAALLCGFGGGCAARNPAERPKDVNTRVTELERAQAEQSQRLAALETRVDALQQRTYDVYTQNGQKTRYVVRPAVTAAPTPVPVPVPVTPAPQPAAAARPPAGTAPFVAATPRAAQPAPAAQSALMLPPEAAPAPVAEKAPQPVAASPTMPAEQAPPPVAATRQPITPPAQAGAVPTMPSEGAPHAQPAPAEAIPATPVTTDARLPQSAKGEDAAYAAALNLVRAGQYAQGREKFQEFLNTYPTGRYAANAYYWMGESYYAQQQYADALAQFRQAEARFPKHHKTADAMLKAGLAYQKLGDNENANKQFRTLLTDFPRSEAAQTARAKGWGR